VSFYVLHDSKAARQVELMEGPKWEFLKETQKELGNLSLHKLREKDQYNKENKQEQYTLCLSYRLDEKNRRIFVTRIKFLSDENRT